jgi:hypothetical protein
MPIQRLVRLSTVALVGLALLALPAMSGAQDRTYAAGATQLAEGDASQEAPLLDPPPHAVPLDGVVYLERETERLEMDGAEPLVDGDRLDTGDGRAEIRWPDGTVAIAAPDTVIDLVDPARLRLVRGILRIRVAAGGALAVDTSPGTVSFVLPGDYLVGLDAAATNRLRATVIRGQARVENATGSARFSAGEQVDLADQGRPEATPATAWLDDFVAWADARLADETRERASRGYLPGELAGYADVLDEHGSWAEEAGYGMVWYPSVVGGWEPYTQGRWRNVGRYGTTWVGSDRWAWPTHHYGRWGYSPGGRWFWIPGRQWAPSWVSWAVGPGYVGWSPLGWNNQPVFSFSGGHGPGAAAWGGWTVVGNDAFMGSRRADRYRVDARQFDRGLYGSFVTQRVPPRFGSTVGAGRRGYPGPGGPGYGAPGAPGYVAPGYGPGGPPPPPDNPYEKAQPHMKPGDDRQPGRQQPRPDGTAKPRQAAGEQGEAQAEGDGRVKRVPPAPRTETPRREAPPRKATPRTPPPKPDPGV